MKKLHLVIVAQEGVSSITCGVGMVVANLIKDVPILAKQLQLFFPSIKVSIITLNKGPKDIGYDRGLWQTAQKLCRKFNGQVYNIKSGFRQHVGYFDIPVWRRYNLQARQKIRLIHQQDEIMVVLHHDIIFGDLQMRRKNYFSIWIPHSMSSVHRQTYSDIAERYDWENYLVRQVNAHDNSYIGYISDYAKTILTKYKVHPSRLVPMYNGFSLKFLQTYHKTTNELKSILFRYRIPQNKSILLAYGRPDEYKGMSITLRSLARYASRHNYLVVMIASRFSDESVVQRIQEDLKMIGSAYARNVLLVTSVEYKLPKYLLQWYKTKLVATLPLRDFAPLIPFEAALLGHQNLGVLVSDIPCFDKVLIDKFNIFKSALTLSAIQRKLTSIDHNQKNVTMVRGRLGQYAQEHCLIADNYTAGLMEILPKMSLGETREYSAGGIIVDRTVSPSKILLVKHHDGYVFPKGHVEPGETSSLAALREVTEETGYIDVSVNRFLGSVKRVRRIGSKIIFMYEMSLGSRRRSKWREEQSSWLTYSQAVASMRYQEDRIFLERNHHLF